MLKLGIEALPVNISSCSVLAPENSFAVYQIQGNLRGREE